MSIVLDRAATGERAVRPGVVLAAVCACTVLVIGFVASIDLAVAA